MTEVCKNSTTIVTCFHHVAGSKHPIEHYENWMKIFVETVSSPMVVFVDNEETKSHLIGLLSDEQLQKTKFIVSEIKDFHVSNAISEESWSKQLEMDCQPLHRCTDLYKIWNEKTAFLNAAIEKDFFDTTHYLWVDIGCFRNANRAKELFPWPKQTQWKAPQDKIVLLQLRPFAQAELDWAANRDSEDFCGPIFPDFAIRVGGGIFGGSKKAIKEWSDIYYKCMLERVSKNMYVGQDQTVMASVLLMRPDLVLPVQVPPGYARDEWFYLHDFFNE